MQFTYDMYTLIQNRHLLFLCVVCYLSVKSQIEIVESRVFLYACLEFGLEEISQWGPRHKDPCLCDLHHLLMKHHGHSAKNSLIHSALKNEKKLLVL